VEEYFDASSRQLDVAVDLEREVYPADRDYGFRRQPVTVLWARMQPDAFNPTRRHHCRSLAPTAFFVEVVAAPKQ
jgi:hypothetical protein